MMQYRCRLCYGTHDNPEQCPYYKPELPEFSEVAPERAPATGQLHPVDLPPKAAAPEEEEEPEKPKAAPKKKPRVVQGKATVSASGSLSAGTRRKGT